MGYQNFSRFAAQLVAICVIVATTAGPLAANAIPNPDRTSSQLERYVTEGDWYGGRVAFNERLNTNRGDDQARYALGVIELFSAVEDLAQGLHRYGLKNESPDLPFMRLPVPTNDKPEPIDYAKFRAIMQTFVDDLARVDETLAKIEDKNVKLKIRMGLVRLDFNSDGKATEDESFWQVFNRVALAGRGPEVPPEAPAEDAPAAPPAPRRAEDAAPAESPEPERREPMRPATVPADAGEERAAAAAPAFDPTFPIGFDYADVHWLRGYTHLLRAMAEAYLAHDSEAFFNATAPQFFAGAKSLEPEIERGEGRPWEDDLANAILAIHLAHFKVIEPKRMETAQRHLLEMVKQSRLCMDAIEAEMDDDREWIPNPKQTSLLPGMNLTRERVEGWREFLNEWEALLTGKKLVPHWRFPSPKRGINLQRVFTEPRDFDLVMWVHGVGALPYFEEGKVTDQETWRRLERTFGGNFLGFAVWVN